MDIRKAKIFSKLFMMRVLVVGIISFGQITVSYGHSQTRITIQEKEKTVKEVLHVIESKTKLNFFYNDKDVDTSRKVTVLLVNRPVTEVLEELFKGTSNSYKINGNQVYITKKTTTAQSNTTIVEAINAIKVRGTITDEGGEGLIGVSIMEKGTTNGTVSDINGNFEIAVTNEESILVFSYIGYLSYEHKVGRSTVINIVLKEDIVDLEEVVVIGYGKQKKESVTAAIASVTSKELVQTPQANISNMLVGRLPGLIAYQRSGAPGEDNSSLLIRGVSTFTDNTSPLVMIDGVERPNFNGIDPNEIESLNILKDASATAIYGVRGANGVILITTRKGVVGAPKLNYSGNFALQQATALPSYLGSYDYARLYNEAVRNDAIVTGSPYIPKFSDEDLELYQNGQDPILHPDTDWISTFMRKFSTRTQHNINLSGGTDRVRFFVSGGYFDQTGIYKHTRIDADHDVNPRNTRYNFRSNLDFRITDEFTAVVQMAAQVENVTTPGSGNSGIWQAISHANPLSSPGFVDGKVIRIQDGVGVVNPWQMLLSNGYTRDQRNNINTTLRLDYDLSRLVTKGLSLHGSVSYDSYYFSRKKYNRSYPYYHARRDTEDPEKILLIPQSEETIWSFGSDWGKNRKTYMEFGLNYEKTLGVHKITSLLLYNQSKYFSPSLQFYVPNAYQGVVGRLTYDYSSRYLAEFNMGYNGTENFAKGKRFGFFPAFSLGWIISEEPLFPKNDFLVFLKVRGSYGEVGNDRIGGDRFLYLPSSYGLAPAENFYRYNFGSASSPNSSLMVIENKIGNPDLTWEKAKKANIGLEANLFKNSLSVTFDLFNEKRNNILANRSTEPMLVGANLPAYNLGEMENHGWEIDVNYRNRIQKFNYWGRFNYSFARNKILYKDEVNRQYAYQRETGRRKDQFVGLIFDGFYNTWEEINALDRPVSAWSGNRLQPGDVKYIDVNKDGLIDSYDMVPIGHTPIPEIIYGFSVGAEYKGFDFSVLFQGAGNVSIKYFGHSMWPFAKGEESAKSLILERWTEERYNAGEKITFPRLSLNPVRETDHNYHESELWTRDASYLRLKNAEIGYTFKGKAIRNMGVNNFRLYLNGSNLITWTDVIDLDPEAPSRSGNYNINTYPLQKVYNFGISINF